MKKVIIVGGVAGGATAAARLRRLDEKAEVVMFERGGHISFANCGLPYLIGGAIKDREDLLLQTPESFHRRFNVDVRVQCEVLSIDRGARKVKAKDRRTGETYEEAYDKLILAPGGAPVIPPIEGMDSSRVFTLRDMADADRIMEFMQSKQPRCAAVAGGGFIGVEMAENLRESGLDVSIIEVSGQLIAPFDIDIACDVHQHLRRHGVTLYLGDEVQEVAAKGDSLAIRLQGGILEADMLILATGAAPENGLAKGAGLAMGGCGGIAVDEHMQTSDPDIYAVGDAVEVVDFATGQAAMLPLAGPANKQARIAADNICGIPSKYAGAQGSAVIKVFDMTAASTGMNEKTARRLGLDYDKIFLLPSGHAGYYPGTKPMSMKVVFDKAGGKILGAQIAGFDGVDKRCDVLAVAVRAGMTAYDLTRLDLCYAPPYSSAKDPVNMAGYAIENILSGRVKSFHWHEVDALPRDGSVTLLDVRETREAARGGIEGFVNIPLDTLRGHIGKLDKAKPTYVHCHSGVRSYIASRILTQNGFDAYNLSGGYRLYRAIMM